MTLDGLRAIPRSANDNVTAAIDEFSWALTPGRFTEVSRLITKSLDSPTSAVATLKEFDQTVERTDVPVVVLSAFPLYYAQCSLQNLVDKDAYENYITRQASIVIRQMIMPYVDMLPCTTDATGNTVYIFRVSDIDAPIGDARIDKSGLVRVERNKAIMIMVTTVSKHIFRALCEQGQRAADVIHKFRQDPCCVADKEVAHTLAHISELLQTAITTSAMAVSASTIRDVVVPPCFESRHLKIIELLKIAEKNGMAIEQHMVPVSMRRLDLHLKHEARVSMITLYKDIGVNRRAVEDAIKVAYVYSTSMPSTDSASIRAHNKVKWVGYAVKGDTNASKILPCSSNPYCTFKSSQDRVKDCAAGFAAGDTCHLKEIEDIALHTPITMAKVMTRLGQPLLSVAYDDF